MRLPADSIIVETEPDTEPVALPEAKLHLRIDHDDEDALIERLISAARGYCEQVSRRALITQTLEGGLDAWPRDNVIELPHPPLQSVESIVYIDSAGATHTLASTVYQVDTKRGRVYLAEGQQWPNATLRTYDPITVTWIAGYGDTAAAVPQGYRQAVLLVLGHLYENREAVVATQGISMGVLPLAVDTLLMTDRGY